MRDRREKDLCYHCDSKWRPRHRCQSLKLYLIEEVVDNLEVNEEGSNATTDQEGSLGLDKAAKCPEISFHAITGSLNPKTMCVKGRIDSVGVTILIDSGNTHNFLDPTLLAKVQLSITTEERVKVKMANGDRMDSEGKVVEVNVIIQ